tara:strand:- start:224 stop:880 length:657 start_codon:yes stop_codon:yes gene_type:complete
MSKISLKHSGGNVVSLNSPTSAPTSADVAFKLPNADGSAGQFMKTDGSGNLSFGAVTSPKVLQVVSQTKTDTASNGTASNTWWSYTDTSLRATLTPSSASNKILLMAQISFSEATGHWYMARFEQDGAELAGVIGDASSNRIRTTLFIDNQADNNAGRTVSMIAQASAGNTNSRYYNIALRHTSGISRTIYINRTGNDGDQYSYGRAISTITAMEIEA